MNLGPYLHGNLRFSNVKGEKNRMYRPIAKWRVALNVIAFILGVSILVLIFANGLGHVFLVGGAFFFGICLIPTTMAIGKSLVLAQYEIAINQHRSESPLEFNKSRVLWGYFLIFSPLYILMLASFFFPAHTAWLVPYIPLFVYTVIVILLNSHTVEGFYFSLKKYYLIHLSIYILIFILGCLIRGLIMYPWLLQNS
ncbi:MAG: hypothetical protein J6B34_02510 [Clostridia bacterium]|nr:hypothetical protein [Clostridia bacterium]